LKIGQRSTSDIQQFNLFHGDIVDVFGDSEGGNPYVYHGTFETHTGLETSSRVVYQRKSGSVYGRKFMPWYIIYNRK
jgi:hypothetical protein